MTSETARIIGWFSDREDIHAEVGRLPPRQRPAALRTIAKRESVSLHGIDLGMVDWESVASMIGDA
jgi:hypothetical protein